MKNKIVLLLGITLGFGLMAHAEWLYWTLDFTESTPPWQTPGQETATPQTAWLLARDDVGNVTSYTSLYAGDGEIPSDLSSLWEEIDVAFKTEINGNPGASYNFYIELGNALGEAAWVSEGKSYTVAKNAGHIAADSMQVVDLTAWTPATWTPTDVPEPTSGLLVVMGMGLLALRRRTDLRA